MKMEHEEILKIVLREMSAYCSGWRKVDRIDGGKALLIQLQGLAGWAKRASSGESVREYEAGSIFLRICEGS